MNQRRRPNSNRGRLIKGMTNKLPYELLNDPTFKGEVKKIMKGYAGIYALYKDEKLYYVGLTSNLHGRIKWHLQDRHAGKWNKFIIFRIKKVNYLKDIETLILHIVKTKGNRAKGKVPKDNDLNRVLHRLLMEHGREYKRLKKAVG